MTLARRHFLALAAGAAVAPLVGAAARAETYPSRPVRFVVPFPPGGVSDIIARLVGQRLAERLGQPFVVEDRGGAGSNLGTEVVVNSEPDGYTLLLGSIATRDYAIIQLATLLFAILVVLANLAADLLYRLLDPRVKL